MPDIKTIIKCLRCSNEPGYHCMPECPYFTKEPVDPNFAVPPDMTIDGVDYWVGCDYESICCDAAEALEKQIPMKVASDIDRSWGKDKYRWHDLRKNPEDLPSEGTDSDFFMCCLVGDSGQGYIYDHGYEVCGYFGSWDAPGRAEVVAWREIEPFEE